jgi:hypothetical protein
MAIRIRYIKEETGDYLSARYIPIKDGEARVSISPHTKEGEIMISGRIHGIKFKGSSLHKLKIAAKNILVSLGAEFDDEERGEDGQE